MHPCQDLPLPRGGVVFAHPTYHLCVGFVIYLREKEREMLRRISNLVSSKDKDKNKDAHVKEKKDAQGKRMPVASRVLKKGMLPTNFPSLQSLLSLLLSSHFV